MVGDDMVEQAVVVFVCVTGDVCFPNEIPAGADTGGAGDPKLKPAGEEVPSIVSLLSPPILDELS